MQIDLHTGLNIHIVSMSLISVFGILVLYKMDKKRIVSVQIKGQYHHVVWIL